jgi:putative hydrolases of HD superfamily
MHIKAPNSANLLPAEGVSTLVQVYFEFNHLKQLFRQGWLQRGIPEATCESVAEHSFSVAILGLFLCSALYPTLDSGRVVRMALLHDFGEVYAGDLTPRDGVAEEEKQTRERLSVHQVLGKLPGGEAWTVLWEEFELNQTPEARLVRQLDRLEMALQASVYEHQGLANLAEFYTSARLAIQDPALLAILDELEQLRSTTQSSTPG